MPAYSGIEAAVSVRQGIAATPFAAVVLATIVLATIAVLAPPSPAAAQRPAPPCADCWWAGPSAARLTHAAASVRIEDARYRTSWTLTFAHPADVDGWSGDPVPRGRLAEGRVIVPLPPGSVVTDLALGDGTTTLEGRLLDADDASRIYEEIVRRLIDPALLRSIGDDLYEIKAFPVPRGETREVRYTVTTPLTAESGEVVIEAPWSRMSPRPATASLSADIDVPWEVRTVLAPGHVAAIDREDSGSLEVSWESPAGWAAERDFRLHLAGGEGLVDARLLAHREAGGEEDGYFALLLAPTLETGERVARDIVIVLDRSGSMYGEKIAQARDAAITILDRLGEADRFGIVSFADRVSSFGEMLSPASAAEDGREWISGIEASGLTNISGALTRAMGLLMGDRPATIVFLTDGLPTAGIEHTDGIVTAAAGSAPGDVQLFAFGVGYDVDTVLLDALTSRFTGSSHYVTPDERIDTEVGRLSERISSPVLLATGIAFELPEGASEPTVGSLAPESPGGLFAGEQVLVTGRYQGSGAVTVVLTGQAARGEQRFAYELALPERGDDPAVALLWAQRRIADLLTELRIEGDREGLTEEIIAIANRFGIVTPYTAYLAEEPDAVFDDDAVMADGMADAAAAPSSGRAAVEAAEKVAELDEGAVEHTTPDAARLVGTRTYYLTSYLGADAWIDEAFDRAGPEPAELSLDAETLASLRGSDPELVAASALGPRVVALGADGWALLAWPEATATTSGGADTAMDAGTTAEQPAAPAGEYVVRAGDFLGRIASHCYGSASRWRAIWEANRDRVMDDGRTFGNPNLIYAGWTLRIPGGCTPG